MKYIMNSLADPSTFTDKHAKNLWIQRHAIDVVSRDPHVPCGCFRSLRPLSPDIFLLHLYLAFSRVDLSGPFRRPVRLTPFDSGSVSRRHNAIWEAI